MKVIQITDEDARSLLDQLKLAKFTEEHRTNRDRVGPELTQEQMYKAVVDTTHRWFHYHVTRWLQTHGADVLR